MQARPPCPQWGCPRRPRTNPWHARLIPLRRCDTGCPGREPPCGPPRGRVGFQPQEAAEHQEARAEAEGELRGGGHRSAPKKTGRQARRCADRRADACKARPQQARLDTRVSRPHSASRPAARPCTRAHPAPNGAARAARVRTHTGPGARGTPEENPHWPTGRTCHARLIPLRRCDTGCPRSFIASRPDGWNGWMDGWMDGWIGPALELLQARPPSCSRRRTRPRDSTRCAPRRSRASTRVAKRGSLS